MKQQTGRTVLWFSLCFSSLWLTAIDSPQFLWLLLLSFTLCVIPNTFLSGLSCEWVLNMCLDRFCALKKKNPSTKGCFSSSSSPSPPALPVLSVFTFPSAPFRSLLIFRGWAAMRIYAEMLTLCVGCEGNYPCIFYTFSALWNPNEVTFPGIGTNQKAK